MEQLDQIKGLGTSLNMYPEMAGFLAETGHTFTEEGSTQILSSSFVTFGEDALRYGKMTRTAMNDMSAGSVDISGIQEVEFLVMMTVMNTLLIAETLANDIARERDQMAAVRSLYRNADDPRRDSVSIILECAALADRVKLHKMLNSPDYVSDFLELRIRPNLPHAIVGSATATYKRMRSVL